MLVVFVLAGILALVHFFSESYSGHAEKYHTHLISFSAGLFLAIIFLRLLPEFFTGIEHIGETIYLLILSGFILFHLGEKYIYQHIKNKGELLQDLASIHVLGFFINHFVVGIALFLAFSIENYVSGLLIFVPLLLHTFSSSLSLNHIDAHFNRKSFAGILLPLSPLLGAAFASIININPQAYHLLFSFVIGALLYIVIRDMVPREESGKPLFFITGALVSVLLLTALSLL